MLQNNVDADLKTRSAERGQTQKEVAEKLGMSLPYVNRITEGRERIVSRAFIAMMEELAAMWN